MLSALLNTSIKADLPQNIRDGSLFLTREGMEDILGENKILPSERQEGRTVKYIGTGYKNSWRQIL